MDALRSIGRDLSELRSKREEKHLAALRKLVGEEQWPWALEPARTLMRHFGDIRAIDRLGDQADFSLSHGAVELAAEQALVESSQTLGLWPAPGSGAPGSFL